VLVHLGVPHALLPAALAGGGARLQQWPGEVGVVLGLAANHPKRRRADVSAIKVEADALGQLLHVLLRQAVVGAGGACLSAIRKQIVLPTDVWVLDDVPGPGGKPKPTITLTTCNPRYSARQRPIVFGDLASSVRSRSAAAA